MITKTQLDDVHKELVEIERLYKYRRERRQTTISYNVSHRLIGLFLQTFDATAHQIQQQKPLKKLQNIEEIKHKAIRDPKTGKFLKGHPGYSRWMKFTYPTELDWLADREQAKTAGFFEHDGKKYFVLFLDGDEKLDGYDVVVADDKIALVIWHRTQIASTVDVEIRTKKPDELYGFWEWLNDYASDFERVEWNGKEKEMQRVRLYPQLDEYQKHEWDSISIDVRCDKTLRRIT
jgi:hypothetical protein